jgi:hypothetical protein
MKTILLLALFPVTCLAQEHALSKTHCQADANLWNLHNDILAADPAMPVRELGLRAQEMANCWLAYRSPIFHTVTDSYHDAYVSRLDNFMVRHNLFPQFIEEDKEGKR